MSFLSQLPNDVKTIIFRLVHKSSYREVMDEYTDKWRINIGYEDYYESFPIPLNYDNNGYSLSYITRRFDKEGILICNTHYFRRLTSYGGAFMTNNRLMCKCEDGHILDDCQTCDQYVDVRHGISTYTVGDLALYWNKTNQRYITKLTKYKPGNCSMTGFDVDELEEEYRVPLPKRYKYSNGGFINELKFIPLEEQ